jgi:hypothetical protein
MSAGCRVEELAAPGSPRGLTWRRKVPGQSNAVKLGVGSCRAPAVEFDTVNSRYHDTMTKQTTVRLPDNVAKDAEAVARVQGTSVNALIVDALRSEIERVRGDKDFTSRARELLERDKELLERLAK